jgi:hypothetical protein
LAFAIGPVAYGAGVLVFDLAADNDFHFLSCRSLFERARPRAQHYSQSKDDNADSSHGPSDVDFN